MDEQERLRSYTAIRAGLIQLTRFARAVEAQRGAEECRAIRADFDMWLCDLEYALQQYCERCGQELGYDVLGISAYGVGTATCLCRPCYDTLSHRARDTLWLGYTGGRLVAYGAQRPKSLAGVLGRAMQRRRIPDYALEHELGLDTTGLIRLALSDRPQPGDDDTGCARIADLTGCVAAVLARLLAEDEDPPSDPVAPVAPLAPPDDTPLPF